MTGHLDKEQLNAMTKQQLEELAAKMQLDTSGRKADLVKRIAEAQVEAPDEEEATGDEAEAEQAAEAAEAADKAAEDLEAQDSAAKEAAAELGAKPKAKAPIEAGGNTLVTCIWAYYDNALKCVIEVGSQLKVTDERAELLKSLKLVK